MSRQITFVIRASDDRYFVETFEAEGPNQAVRAAFREYPRRCGYAIVDLKDGPVSPEVQGKIYSNIGEASLALV